ncbi:hypothetical protein GCM10028826_17660 [Mucilaginibacter boryungensis]
MTNLSNGDYESESDRYTYNFNGHSGAFRYDINGNMHMVPYAPVKITKNYLNNDPSVPQDMYFTIVDEQGTQYIFKAGEVSSQGGGGPLTGWNVTKIISADGNDEINFSYSTGETIEQLSQTWTVITGDTYNAGTGVPGRQTTVINPVTATYHSPQRLVSITTKNALITFDYLADRTDGRQFRINKVTVYSLPSNTIIKQVSFDQSYFGSSANHTLRMRLDALHISNQSTAVQNYSFVYNDGEAPGYYYTPGYMYEGSGLPYIIKEDYWGYNGGNGGLPSEFLNFLNSSELAAYGGNLNPCAVCMQAYMLREIHYPTGGKTTFEYEPNQTNNPNFYGYPNQVNANNGIVGGLRIKSIKSYADNTSSPTSQKNYTYDGIGAEQQISPALFRYVQQYYYYDSDGYSASPTGHPTTIKFLGIVSKDVVTSSSVFPLTIMDGSPVIYSQVTEYNGTSANNIGKTVYTYDVSRQSTMTFQDIQSAPRFIASYHWDKGTNNPLLQKKEYYKNENGVYTLVKKTENQYSYLKTNSEFITGVKVAQFMTFKDVENYFPSTYAEVSPDDYVHSFNYEDTKGFEDVSVLTQTQTTDNSDPAHPVVQTVSYQYSNEDHLQPTQKTVSSSNTDTWITQYKYPHDFSGQSPYNLMVNTFHIWSPVIEQLEYKNNTGNFLQSTKTDYGIWNGNNAQIYPSTVYSKKSASSYDSRVQLLGYDTNGNIQSVKKVGGPKINYVYGYGGHLPIAQITSADYSTIETLLGGSTAVQAFRDILYPTDAQVNNFLTPLRVSSNLPNAQVITYTYQPLVGMTSATDARGNTITYEYDNFQRLINVKDQNGNIKTHYCYNYAGQQTDCTVPVVPVTQMVYAKLIPNNSYSTLISGYSHTFNDYLARLYTDAACTIPYTTPTNLTVSYLQAVTTTDSNNNSTTNTYIQGVVVPANSNTGNTGYIDVSGCFADGQGTMSQTSKTTTTTKTTTTKAASKTSSTSGGATTNGLPGGGEGTSCNTTVITITTGTGYTPVN